MIMIVMIIILSIFDATNKACEEINNEPLEITADQVQFCLGKMEQQEVSWTLHLTTILHIQGLIKSTAREDQQEGVRLLSDIFRQSPDRRRECLYYLALGNYKLGNYAEARKYNDLLLDHEPQNLQAGSLKQLIDDKVARDGMIGAALVGGLAVAAGIAGSMIFKGARRR